MQIQFLEGEAVVALMDDPRFQADWQQLCARVPDATGFQSPGFAYCWYRNYDAEWQPVLLLQRAADGVLCALWPLAYHAASGVLSHAGQHQAEYQGWLALPELERRFLETGWQCLLDRLPFQTLRVKYLQAGRAAELLREVMGAERVQMQPCRRPLMLLDAAQIQASFAKKSNKSRFNRLKKLGALTFRRVTEATELEGILDELIQFYDFRQAAVNHTAPFREDKSKRAFHLALFARAGAEQCVTVTYLDARPIAAFWGTVSGKTVHLGMLISSPFLAEHSPGKLHLMQLSDYLVQQGMQVLDLTPGGDPWKERFANSHDEVFDVTLYRHAGKRRAAEATAALLARLKAGLGRVGITPAQVRELLHKLQRANTATVLRKLRRMRGFKREYRVYRIDRATATGLQGAAKVHVNAIGDLLCFEPAETWQSRDGFLANALECLESGIQAYTICQDGQLAHSGWMAAQTSSYMAEVKQRFDFPKGSVSLFDFYSDPSWRDRGYYRLTLGRMVHDAFADPVTQYVYIMVLGDNAPSRRVIEKLGFVYQASYFLEQRAGTERTWQQPA